MPVDGDLKDFEISSVVQLLCTERRSVGLVVRRRGEEGILYLEEGEIVHALLGPLEGEQAAFQLLTWQDGTFRISDRMRPPAKSIRTGWRHLVLEAARQMDESERDRAGAAAVSALGSAVLPVANDDGVWPAAADDELEGELMLLLSRLEQEMARLGGEKAAKRPLLALETLAEMVNQAVAFAEGGNAGPERATPEAALALAAALKSANAKHPMARVLKSQSGRLAVGNAVSFYRTWAADTAERRRVFRDIAHAMSMVLESFLDLAARRLRSATATADWRESCGVFLRDLSLAIDRIAF